MKLSLAKIIGIILIIALPLFIWVIRKNTNDQSKANILPLSSVRINPEVINTDLNGPNVYLSALAYDTGGSPIGSGIRYQWGISTTNSIGTLSNNRDDKLAMFTPSKTNRGRGDIYVIAFEGTTQVTKSIPVYVGPTPTPTPTANPERFSCSTDADCGCGLDRTTRNCAIQNRRFLTGRCNAPDYCSGITGRCGPKCVSGRCQFVCPNISPTATPTPSPTQEPNLNPPVCVPSSIPPATGSAPLTVTLHGGGNAGAGTGLDGYRWDYDNNGTWDSGVSLNPVTHTYVSPGTYNPKYQIRGSNGVWSSICNYPYTVVAQPPATTSDHKLDIIVRFAGVPDGRADGAKATIRFINGTLDLITSPRIFTHAGNGNYKTTLILSQSQLPPGQGYTVIVKGEKHLARKYCKASGQTTICQSQETITLPVPTGQTTTFTFTGLPLDPGDLRAQDGRADLSDFAKIKDRMNISCSLLTDTDKLIADINYSGCIDSMDAYWMRHTLETRYDEN